MNNLKKIIFKLKWIQIWKDGFEHGKKGMAFSMNPYPIPNKTNYGYDNLSNQRKVWSKGYWKGAKCNQ